MPPRLTDLGLTTPSQSNSVSSAAGPGLRDIMNDTLLDEVAKSRLLESQLDSLGDAQPRSPLQVLSNPKTLAAIAAAVAGLASGKRTGQGLGLGALMGTLQQAQQVSEAERVQLSSAREDLNDKLEKSLDRQDKTRNRLANIFNTNPEAFQGPGGEAPPPEVLAWYITGQTNMPLWTSTRRALNRRDDIWDKRTDLLAEALKQADSPETARTLTRGMLMQLDVKDPPPEMVEAYTSAFGSPDAERITWKNHYDTFALGARDAHVFAIQNGNLSPSHPAVLKRLTAKPSTGAAKLSELQIQMMDFVRAWELAPANAAQAATIRRDTTDAEEAQRLINEVALQSSDTFAGVDAQFLNEKIGANRDFLQEMAQLTAIDRNVGMRDTAIKLLIKETVAAAIGLTPEELRENQRQTALTERDELQQNARDSDAQFAARQMNDAEATMAEQVPGFSGVTYKRASAKIAKIARKTAANPDGTIDRVKYEAEIKSLLLLALLDLQDARPAPKQ